MAERRMLHRAACTSPDIAWLRSKHGPDAALFAVLLIPWYDRWGCVPADPGRLRAMVVPTYDEVTVRDVKRWTEAMVRRGMLDRVTNADGERGLRNPSFHEHQAGVQWEREAPSPWEPPEVTDAWRRKPRSSLKGNTGSYPQPPVDNSAGADKARTTRAPKARTGRAKGADTQGGRRPVSDQSKTGLVEGKGIDPSPRSPSPDADPDPDGASVGSNAPRPTAALNGSDEPRSAAELLERLRGAQ